MKEILSFPIVSVLCVLLLLLKNFPIVSIASPKPTPVAIPKSFSANASPQPTDEKAYNVQLDNKGLTLRLDFLNLTSEDVAVLESLFDYKTRLETKAKEIMKKESAFQIVESRISQQLGELERLRDEVKKLIMTYDAQEEKRLNLMVKIYENMKPEQAAQILSSLPEKQIIDILSRMKEAKSSSILASLPPALAGQITENMLQRNAMM
jgi:flagellar motility protein MotE (MotC chaperone)